MRQKVILVTGASSGIGRASALSLVRRGHTVYGAARRTHLMEDLVTAGGHALPMDVTDDRSVTSSVDLVVEEQGRIDAVFANAGYCLLGAVENLPIDEVTKQFDTNVVGVGRAVKAVLPHMRAQRSGTLAICSSGAGHVSVPGMAWYPATKFALQGLADALRVEVRQFGVHVTLIEPGYTDTGIDDASLPYLDLAARHRAADAYARQRDHFRRTWSRGVDEGASPDTIAKAVVRAVESARPRRRYHPTMDARAAYWARRLVPAALIDRVIAGASIGR